MKEKREENQGISDSMQTADHLQIQGNWTVTGMFDEEGRLLPIPSSHPHQSQFVFTADTLSVHTKTTTLNARFWLNPQQEPKEIDTERLVNGEKLRFKGIYTLTEKELYLCLAGPEQPRPQTFAAGPHIEFALQLAQEPAAAQAQT